MTACVCSDSCLVTRKQLEGRITRGMCAAAWRRGPRLPASCCDLHDWMLCMRCTCAKLIMPSPVCVLTKAFAMHAQLVQHAACP